MHHDPRAVGIAGGASATGTVSVGAGGTSSASVGEVAPPTTSDTPRMPHTRLVLARAGRSWPNGRSVIMMPHHHPNTRWLVKPGYTFGRVPWLSLVPLSSEITYAWRLGVLIRSCAARIEGDVGPSTQPKLPNKAETAGLTTVNGILGTPSSSRWESVIVAAAPA